MGTMLSHDVAGNRSFDEADSGRFFVAGNFRYFDDTTFGDVVNHPDTVLFFELFFPDRYASNVKRS